MTLWSRLRALGYRLRRRASWERALHDELQAYLHHEIDARIEGGMSPSQARRTALADFGGVEQVKEHVRSGAPGAWLNTLWQDLRYACRVLQHSRGFTTWVVGSLAIGMAVTIATLALLNASLILPFPEVTEQKRLVRVSVSRNCGGPDCWTRMSSPADYVALRDGLTGLQALAGYTQGEIAVALPEARSMRSALTSANYFDVLGVRPAVGRVFDATDAETNAAVAVIAYSVWTFGQGAAPGSIVVWHPTDAQEDGRGTIGGYAGGDLFEAVGLRIVAGRGFTEGDRQPRPQVAVVNQTFAQNMNASAVGSILRVAPRDQDFGSSIDVRIVGIIEPALEPRYTQDGPPAAKVYLPSPIEPEPALALYIRTRATATTLAQPVRQLVSHIAPRVPILELGSLEELNERSYGPQLWLARAAAILGVIGLLGHRGLVRRLVLRRGHAVP